MTRSAPRPLLLCPSCYRRNRAWVLYSRCPFCGAKGKPVAAVIGPGWETALAETLGEGHADRCGAPLCWGDPAGLSPRYLWYPDEPICTLARTNEPGVARRMRRIARLAKVAPRPEPDEPGYPGLADTYFTLADLRAVRRVDRRIRGRNPDFDANTQTDKHAPARARVSVCVSVEDAHAV